MKALECNPITLLEKKNINPNLCFASFTHKSRKPQCIHAILDFISLKFINHLTFKRKFDDIISPLQSKFLKYKTNASHFFYCKQ